MQVLWLAGVKIYFTTFIAWLKFFYNSCTSGNIRWVNILDTAMQGV